MSVEVGQKISGKVTGITNFGAFVELPEGKTGLIHISEVSNSYVKDINDVLTVGQEIEVKVLTVSPDGKISLSAKQAVENTEAPKSRPQRKEYRPTKDGDKAERSQDQSAVKPRFNKRTESNNASTGNYSTFGNSANTSKKSDDFDSLMSNFLKDSEDRLSSLRRNTEGKRGGRGGRRS